MNKKKIIGLCIAGTLAIGCIGGSLAWFTSSDSVTNPFSTASTDNPNNPNSGIEINENFDKTTADNTLPGDEVTKQVSVENKATYDQLIRVKIKKVWKDTDGNEITSIWLKGGQRVPSGTEGATEQALNTDYIVLNFKDNLSADGTQGKWIQTTDANQGKDGGYYYYNDIVAPKGNTSNCLESVTLSGNTPNEYKGLKFDVIVESEGVQAANGAASDSWQTAPQAIKDLGASNNAHK